MSLREHVVRINARPWQPVTAGGLAIAGGLVAYIAWFSWRGDGWVPLMDSANFAVHEAGHPLVGIFSDRLAAYGGTLAQLLFPAICVLEFWRRREALSCALGGIWLGQSLLNVARYVADARALALPLAGFSEHALHDWNVILSRWGLLREDLVIASGLRAVAWLGIAAALAFAVRRWLESR